MIKRKMKANARKSKKNFKLLVMRRRNTSKKSWLRSPHRRSQSLKRRLTKVWWKMRRAKSNLSHKRR